MAGEKEQGDTGSPRIAEGLFGYLEISSPKRTLVFVACCALALGVQQLALRDPGLSLAAARALFILVLAAALWVTEAIPPFATGMLVIGLKVFLLGNPDAEVFATSSRDWERFVVVIGHPLVWLFFGGFVLAAGMARTGLDRRIATSVLGRLGDRPSAVLFGVMAITFSLSMFVSNTATTAMMLALLAPLLASLPVGDLYARGLLLGTAAAANLGGMGSLIGTPPNAIAVGGLAELPTPIEVSFLDWMFIGLPPAVLLLAGAWLAIGRLYPSTLERLDSSSWTAEPEGGDAPAPRWQRWVAGGTVALTVGLWLTTQWHGAPTAAISFIPIVLFSMTGVLGVAELRGLSWDVIFLLAGGLALGETVVETGLSAWLVQHVPIQGLATTGLALLMAYVTVILSNLMSNTAAANILVPLSASMAPGSPGLAVAIALGASLAMCLPISTPPNALAFASGRCETRDFLRLGLALGLVGPVVVIAWGRLIFRSVIDLP